MTCEKRESCNMPRFLCTLLVMALMAPGMVFGQWHSRDAAMMGTRIHIELWHESVADAAAAIDAALVALSHVDRTMSPYRPDSEVSRINRSLAGETVAVGPELVELIERSLAVSRLTDGAFDISFAAAGRLYDYRQGVRPAEATLAQARQRIDYRLLRLDSVAGRVGFAAPGMALDLGGIAKGYAVELAVARLRDLGIRHALVSAGGDTRVLGTRRGRPWLVALRDPRDAEGLLTRTPLVDEAISTSGDYERYFEADGRRYHHILNPATGDSARGMRSVTVIGPDATMTDALSTSVFVLGVDAGLALIDSLDAFESIVVDGTGRLHYSAGLRPLAATLGAGQP